MVICLNVVTTLPTIQGVRLLGLAGPWFYRAMSHHGALSWKLLHCIHNNHIRAHYGWRCQTPVTAQIYKAGTRAGLSQTRLRTVIGIRTGEGAASVCYAPPRGLRTLRTIIASFIRTRPPYGR